MTYSRVTITRGGSYLYLWRMALLNPIQQDILLRSLKSRLGEQHGLDVVHVLLVGDV